ncbi:GSCFA domain-containing protein [Limimaricola litoreus]|uniref:GSCFA domain-containing protein n=1 Tax=Limimaricola litoreus TaxID=2955316 RepID=A0A9X2JSH4_9RHOB|nr:GSCFA domain-containing protein [Limimaricola litoreus]MCP1169771.1 GSCFA domain-containing protein [Limimaricola litoreus]
MDRNIEAVPATEAFGRARGNRLRRYPSPERDGDRLYPLAAPTASPSFAIEDGDTIFAIGSCFARNVERALDAAGRRIISREFELGEIGESLGDAANFFNKYSIHSVLNELGWALERDSFPGAEILYDNGGGRFSDAQLGMARLDFPVEKILDFRHRYLDAMARVAEADVVIVTLGYVETWYDRKLRLYLNVAPPQAAVKAEPERFEFRVLSYADVLDGLERLHALLLRHRQKSLKMLVTVSPVPLLATFREMDVLVANAYSKSVQRAAIEEFVTTREGVDYFPSYEFVTLSNPAVAWSRNDYRHVSPDLVNRIMSNVLDRYVVRPQGAEAQGGMTLDALLSSMRMLARLDDHEALRDLARQQRELVETSIDALMLEATAARRLGDLGGAHAVLLRAADLAPTRPDPVERLITLCRPLKRHEEARVLCDRHARDFPERGAFRERLDWL